MPAGSQDQALADFGVVPGPPAAEAPGSPCRYHLVVIALIYFLPLAVMFVAYSVIGLTLWRRAVPGQQTHGANLRHLQAKKKVGAGTGPGGEGGSWSWPVRKRAPGRSLRKLPLREAWGQSLTEFLPGGQISLWCLATHKIKETSQNVRGVRDS